MPKPSPDPLVAAWSTIITELGYPADDPHLEGSPERVARFLRSWHTQAVGKDPPALTTFEETEYEGIVTTGALPFYAVCAHHGLPFVGTASIGYVPDGHVLGLSKFARVLDFFSHRFTTQERITVQVAKHLEDNLKARGIGVVLRAEHMCMSMRGVQKPGHSTVTSDMRGVFRSDPAARAELLDLFRSSK